MANLKDTSVKYINKDFQGFKRDLMRYAQAHFSGSYQDYNESSPGMMILELQAYIADVLAFYADQQFLEIKQNTARQIENIEDFAKMRGYKPKGARPARVPLYFIAEVPASGSAPDPKYIPAISAGAQAIGPGGTVFETIEDLNLGLSSAANPQTVRVSKVDGGGNPTFYAVRRWVDAVAGQTTTETISVGDFTPFYRMPLGASDVQEVLDVVDREGNQWYEVDYLAQNAVLDQTANTTSDSGSVPYSLKWRSASRRFTVDYSVATNITNLQFGNGAGLSFDDELIPSIAAMALPVQGKSQITNFTLDPQNFLKTRGLGLSPANTSLTIRYRVGGGTQTNVPTLSINKVQSANLTFSSTLSSASEKATANAVRSSLEVINLRASEGGGDAESASEIKVNAASYFAAQARAVTREDFLAHILSMPVRFGRAEKAFIKNSDFNEFGVDIHVLSLDPDGKFQKPTSTLRENIKTYLKKLRMLTEGVTILNANVINLGLNFGVVISPRFNRSEVLTNCLTELKSYVKNSNMQIGMPLVRSDIEAILQNVNGVISVYKLELVGKFGSPYTSDINFDVEANTKHGIVYCPGDAIFEVRFPDTDIVGESK
jgi:hypothetical protein